MKRVILFFCLLVFLTLSSCSTADNRKSPTSVSTQTSTSAPTPTTTIAPSPTVEPILTEDNTANINIFNDTGGLIFAIFIFPDDFSGQPENYIENQILMDGDTIDVAIEKGEYIFEVWDCQMNTIHDLYGFIIEDDLEWNLSEIPEEYTYEGQQLII